MKWFLDVISVPSLGLVVGAVVLGLGSVSTEALGSWDAWGRKRKTKL